MKNRNKKALGMLALLLFATLSLYATQTWPQHHPTTTQILENPEKHEAKPINMRGILKDIQTTQQTHILKLERHTNTFEVHYPKQNTTLQTLKPQDVIDIKGYSYLTTQGHIQATHILPRPQTQHQRMFLLSIIAIALTLSILIKDRKQIFKVIFDA